MDTSAEATTPGWLRTARFAVRVDGIERPGVAKFLTAEPNKDLTGAFVTCESEVRVLSTFYMMKSEIQSFPGYVKPDWVKRFCETRFRCRV